MYLESVINGGIMIELYIENPKCILKSPRDEAENSLRAASNEKLKQLAESIYPKMV